MKWLKFWKLKPVAPLQFRVIDLPVSELRLHEFRADEKLTAGAAIALNGQYMTMAIQVLKNEHPAWGVMSPDVPEHVRAAYQAKCEGYTLCLMNLLAMGKHEPLREQLIAEFADEEYEPKRK